MHRTQIYLEEAQYETLRRRASREGKSMAALVRQVLEQYLETLGPESVPFGDDPLDQVIGIGSGDGAPVAEQFEDYLYGQEP